MSELSPIEQASFVFDEFTEAELHEKCGELGTLFINDNHGYKVRELRTFEWMVVTAQTLGGYATISQNGELSQEARVHNAKVGDKANPVGKRIFAVVVHGLSREEFIDGLLHLDPLDNRTQY